MSLLNSLYTGVSGLRSHQTMMDVIGDNIANVNSIGFKGSRVTFGDTFSQYLSYGSNPTDTSGGTNSSQIGLGVKINSIDRNWSQGTFESTGIATDLGLSGSGMFILDKNGQRYFSRAGNFSFDANGTLVNSENGATVMGKMASADGTIPAGNNLTAISVDSNMKLPATATTNIKWTGNLSSSATLTRSESYIESGSINKQLTVGQTAAEKSTVYDTNGNAYSMTTTYTKTAQNTYDVTYAMVDSAGKTVNLDTAGKTVTAVFDDTTGKMTSFSINGAAQASPYTMEIKDTDNHGVDFNFKPGDVTEANNPSTLTSSVDGNRTSTAVTGTLTIFDSLGNSHSLTLKFTKLSNNVWAWNGSMPSGSGTLNGNSGTITFSADGEIASMSPTTPTLSYSPSGGAGAQNIALDFGTAFSGITQTSSNSSISPLSQNGMASASLMNVNVDQNGKVVGVFSNGQSKDLAQLMLANFTNLNGLTSSGNNLYQVSANSGDPTINEAGAASRTTIQSGSLEQSNVDLSQEFTRMIVSQRGFQANARIITTSDSLLQEITNLVR
jgi:flagellar hook protein FlgE